MVSILQSQVSNNGIAFLPLRKAIDTALVGGKAASLGSLLRNGLSCPDGVVLPVGAYHLHADYAFRQLPMNASDQDRAAAILASPFPSELLKELTNKLPATVQWPVAVRSSATFEDSASVSCAGQFDTFLNVSSFDELLCCIRKTWASFWSEHARQYSVAQNRNSDASGMAVVIQSMVIPLFSGVAFSVDPTAADPNVLYVEWVKGSGELLVSGERISGRAWLGNDGRLFRVDRLSNEIAPIPAMWKLIAQATRAVEFIHGGPQDVEWAWSHDHLVLLQSRPITKVHALAASEPPPWLLAGSPAGGWTEFDRMLFDQWDEYNPPTVKPLEMDLFMAAVWQSSLDMLDDGSGVPPIESVVLIYNEVPIQVDPTASQSRHSLWPRGSPLADLDSAMTWGAGKIAEIKTRLTRHHSDNHLELIRLLEEIADIHRTLNATRLRHMQSWIQGENAARNILEPFILAAGQNVERVLERLVVGVEHDTNLMNREMNDLADRFHSGRTSGWQQAFEAFLDKFGHFQNNGIPIVESPDNVFRQIEQLAQSKAAKRVPRGDLLALDVEAIRQTVSSAERSAFDDALSDLRRWHMVRENTKTRADIARPLLRRVAHMIGLNLVARQVIPLSEDLWLLTFSELSLAFREGQTVDSDLLESRRSVLAWKSSRSWIPDGFFSTYCRSDASHWRGLAASPGTASGIARVIAGPEQFADVGLGDIVVARSTNPVWTQLFNRIAGIVVENGSRLSHAAVVAREYGIPAVVGLPGILDAVRDGEKLSLNGDTGEVSRSPTKLT